MIVCTENVFTLHTTHTSYQLAVAPNGMVLHTYYGTRLPEDVPSLADARMPHSDPGCVMGAHFSTVPNHCTGHISTMEARMAAALTGTFGFELDLTKYSEEELAELRPYVAWYRQHGALLRGGDLHRLVDPEPNGLGAAWMITAKDGSEAAVFAVGDALTGSHGVASANSRPRLMLEGLDPAAQYTDEDANTYSGVQLLTTGLELPGGWGQTPAKIWYLKKV